MARYARKRRGVGRVLRKARVYRSMGASAFGRRVGRYAVRKVSNTIHNFRKQFTLPTIVDTGTLQNHSYAFKASSLVEWPEFKELYDQYLIKKIILSFEPQLNGSNTAAAPYQNWMRIVHDYDDNLPLVTESDYLEYSNCKSKLVNSPRVINTVLYPKVLKPSLETGGVAVYSGAKSGWISTDYDDVEHLGIKVFTPSLGVSGFYLYKVRVTMFMAFKNSR